MALPWLILCVLISSSKAADVELLECEPPDIPVWGGYGPMLRYYLPGDIIHYFCDIDTHIGGNYKRKCLDTGDWSGDTPVCDGTVAFKDFSQSSNFDEDSTAELAIDGIRTTCTETIGGEIEEWYGNFTNGGQLLRVMLYLPKGPADIQVVLVKKNGEEVVCGRITENIDRYDWKTQNCPEPNNVGAIGLKLKSMTNNPLKICEVQAYVLSSPVCVDPHYRIESGHLRLTRKTATLVCDKDYQRSPDAKLECVRDGQWNRKTLYCQELDWEREELTSNED